MVKHLDFGLACLQTLFQAFETSYTYFRVFVIELLWTLTFDLLTEACRVWNVNLGLFLFVLQSWIFRMNLLGCPLMERPSADLSVFHLWVIFLSAVELLQTSYNKPQSVISILDDFIYYFEMHWKHQVLCTAGRNGRPKIQTPGGKHELKT